MQLPKRLYVTILIQKCLLVTLQKLNLNTAGVDFTYTVEPQNSCELRLKKSNLGCLWLYKC
jgi:hypothetical protein